MALALLVAQPGCETEKAKWNLAQAINLSQSGEIEEAITLSQQAMEQDPDNCQIKRHLAQLLAENGRGEIAVALCDVHQDCFPNDLPAREVRSTCLQYLGRFDESLAEYKNFLSTRVARSPSELNTLAYFRALANKELGQAGAEIQEAIEQIESKYWGAFILPMQVRAVVSAGLISRHVDGRRQALRLLDRMIDQYEAKLVFGNTVVKQVVTEKIGLTYPISKQHENQTLNARANREIRKSSLAVMLVTRALILEDCKQTERVDADRRRIEALGYEFSKLASSLPSDLACLDSLDMATMYLDTRGFISVLQPWPDEMTLQKFNDSTSYSSYQEAIEDLDLSVLAAQLGQAALNSSLYNSMELPVEKVMRRKEMARRVTAVLLYHRMKAYQRGGRAKAAAKDQCRIQALGFPPDASLF